MRPDPEVLGFLAFAVAVAAFTLLGVGIARAAGRKRPTPTSAAPVQSPPPAPGRAPKVTCTVTFQDGTFSPCTSPVQVHVSAGHDYYPFCLVHGLPYLREGLGGDDLASIEDYANGEAS